jgi:hypothetical protein
MTHPCVVLVEGLSERRGAAGAAGAEFGTDRTATWGTHFVERRGKTECDGNGVLICGQELQDIEVVDELCDGRELPCQQK